MGIPIELNKLLEENTRWIADDIIKSGFNSIRANLLRACMQYDSFSIRERAKDKIKIKANQRRLERMNNLPKLVYNYTEKFFQKKDKTEFPTVRRVSRALKVKIPDILQAIEDHEHMFTSGHNIENITDGSLYVETTVPD